MGKTGTEKPLKAPKKKSKELDDDDLAALARKKEEQAKLNALKKQVAGGGKLGKGLQKTTSASATLFIALCSSSGEVVKGTSMNSALLCVRDGDCLLYTSPSPRDATLSRMPSSA